MELTLKNLQKTEIAGEGNTMILLKNAQDYKKH